MNWEELKNFSLGEPWWLLGLILLPILAWLQSGRRPAPAIRFSAVAPLRAVAKAKRSGWGGFGRLLLFFALALLIVALARPRLGKSYDIVESSGLDIILTLDVSGSMNMDDFTLDGRPATRIDAVKLVARRFIEARPNDRIGIVLFAQVPALMSPATLDHGWLIENLDRVQAEMFGRGGTYIAAAIGNAANRLADNKTAKSRIMILLTDGAQTVGTEDPVTAAQAAGKLGVKIYTIGAGSDQPPEQSPLGLFRRMGPAFNPADEEALRKIAVAGNGKFFRATDTESLTRIFEEIDKMEKTEVKLKHKTEWRELFDWFVAVGASLLALRTVLVLTIWRTVP
jgi:Ca-activated chloride channel homolog